MDLFLVELRVADWPASLAWYRDRLGLAVELLDEPNRYALLSAGPCRVALNAGTPSPGSTKLAFRVSDLGAEIERLGPAGISPTGPIRASIEGYRSVLLVDPDGHRVELFEWVRPSESASPPVPRLD
jgi:catechol 2,3-dioxygenase-like lactoylglutathione lyase family enzyme